MNFSLIMIILMLSYPSIHSSFYSYSFTTFLLIFTTFLLTLKIINNFLLVLSSLVSSFDLLLSNLSVSLHSIACCYRFVPCFLGLSSFGCTSCMILGSAKVGINLLSCSRLIIIRIEMFISSCISYRCLAGHGLSEKTSTLEAEKICREPAIHPYQIFSIENWVQQLARVS